MFCNHNTSRAFGRKSRSYLGKKMSYLYFTAAVFGSVVIASPFLLVFFFSFPPFPRDRVKAFLQRCSSAPIAHRGGVPENTLAALRRAKERGCEIVEVDLEFTKDGHAVLLHDPSVDRTSNGSGLIRDMSFEEVRKLDFGSKFGSEFAGEKIPTLQETFELCEQLDLFLILDVKSNRRKTAAMLKQLFREQNLYDRVVVSSFYPELIYMVRCADPNILVSLAMRNWEFTWEVDGSQRHDKWWRQMLAPFYDIILTICNNLIVWRLVGQSFILMHKGDIKKELVESWRRRNVHLIAWTMQSNEEAQRYSTEFNIPVLIDYTD